MRKSDPQPDVLVLGGHPAAYLAAALLQFKTPLRILHATLPGEQHPERLVLINAALYSLHKLLAPLQRRLPSTPIYGLRFLGDDIGTASEYRSTHPTGFVALYSRMRTAMAALAQEQGVQMLRPDCIQLRQLDEQGVELLLGKDLLWVKALVLAGRLLPEQQRLLGLPDSWGEGIVHRHTFVLLKGRKWADLGNHPTAPMSLDLKGTLSWAWMLPSTDQIQLCITQPIESVHQLPSEKLLAYWADVLLRHGVLRQAAPLEPESMNSMDIPLAGALAQEGVANRTLLVGPAGGFYSACSEDIYPNCWSTIFAADVLGNALKERHLQDAINAYRSSWRTTLGEYLRGPQQNLRFLLPLVYRNPVMTNRLGESILLGRNVVR